MRKIVKAICGLIVLMLAPIGAISYVIWIGLYGGFSIAEKFIGKELP